MVKNIFFLIFVGLPFILSIQVNDYHPLYGTYVGKLSTLHHKVTGDVYAVDSTTILIKGFFYDGEAPDALFFAGNNSPEPSHKGFVIPDEKGKVNPLHPYTNRDIILKFPVTKKGQRSFNDVKWISVWCRKFAVDFGHVLVTKKLKLPKQFKGGPMRSHGNHITASNIIIQDADTFLVEGLKFDGSIRDAIFVMGSGEKNGAGFQIADERGNLNPLKRYSRQNLTLRLPREAKGKHIQYFGIWSPSKGMIASLTFPSDMRVPPSMKK